MWIKICANTNLEDAKLAAELGADAVGFVFARSPRQVTPAQAAAITPYLPANVERIGVFHDHDVDFEKIAGTVQEAGLTGVQLHGGYSVGVIEKLRDLFGDTLRVIQSVHWQHWVEGRTDQTRELSRQLAFFRDPEIDAVLVDSRTAVADGGTGVAFDWLAARESLSDLGDKPLIVAGGLNDANVDEAIRILHPIGVDVATGVEDVLDKRRKDPERLRAFIAHARAAGHPSDKSSK